MKENITTDKTFPEGASYLDHIWLWVLRQSQIQTTGDVGGRKTGPAAHFSAVCFLQVDMAETHRVTTQGRKRWTVPQRHGADGSKAGARCSDAQTHLAVPFRGHISGGMQPGKKVVVVAVVDSRPDRFYVALTCGCGTNREPPPDVALELCVRFRDQQVLRRACVSGSWGDVEGAVPFFPFIRDQPFKLEIHCEHGRFRVFVDGQQLFDFSHRLTSLRDVDTLWIKGNVTVTKLA
ncbi:galectin-related protein-like isoform X2 [Mastacembelus armatus]|nr:galectin-related protein-like isoform X2 [Mastacembelus armatus]